MKIVTWNIRHGGSKEKLPTIVDILLQQKADVLVITEFQIKSAAYMQERLTASPVLNEGHQVCKG